MQADAVKEFKESISGKEWATAVNSQWFHEGLRVALLQVHNALPNAQDMGTAAANHWREKGARDLARILATLTDSPPSQKPPRGNLNHTA